MIVKIKKLVENAVIHKYAKQGNLNKMIQKHNEVKAEIERIEKEEQETSNINLLNIKRKLKIKTNGRKD